jgi:hypothetical protein
MSNRRVAQLAFILCLVFVGALPFLSACKKTYKISPLAPVLSNASATVTPTSTASMTPTVTLTPDCNYPIQTLALPTMNAGSPTFPLTATPVPTWQAESAIRSQSDWDGFCAYVGADPLVNPAPVNFANQMIIYRMHAALECPIAGSLESLCRYSDRYEVTIKETGNPMNFCPDVYMPWVYFDGYVVDQAPVSIIWKIDDQTTGGLLITPIIPFLTPTLTATPTP